MRRVWMIVVVAALALAPVAGATAPVPTGTALETDGSVTQIQRVGDELMLTGWFSQIGPYIGSGVGMDPASGAVDPAFPRFDGQVSDAIGDGNGGLYVGGQFLLDGAGKVHHLVHLLPSGALDPAFTDTADDFVTALALANGRLYATRWFAGGVRSFEAATGTRLAKTENDPAFPSELELANGRLYVGGYHGVVAFNPATAVRDDSFDCEACATGGQVSAMAHDGTRLYVGRRGGSLMAVDLDSGARDTAFAPGPGRKDEGGGPGGTVDKGPLVLAVDGSRLLVGGSALTLGGPSTTLVALDKTTGEPDPRFANGFAEPVHDMVVDGDSLLVSGAPHPRGPGAPSLTTLDRATGTVTSSINTALDGTVDALAETGSRLFVGGRFRTRAAVPTRSLALVDAKTGALVPGFSAAVNVVRDYGTEPTPVAATDHTLVFWRTVGSGRRHVALKLRALSRDTGALLTDFQPPTIRFDPSGKAMFPGHYPHKFKTSIYDPVVLGDADRIYIGHVIGNDRTVWPWSRVDVLSATTGRRIGGFRLPLKGYLTALALRDGVLYAGGSFRRVRFGHPAHLATLALDPATGALDPSFDAHTNGPVYGIGVEGDNLYLSGIFKRAAETRRVSIAAVDARHGDVDPRFEVAGTHFAQTAVEFGPPLPLDAGILNVGRPSGYYPFTVAPVDATTGRRIATPFEPDAFNTLLPVDGRWYGAVTESLSFQNYAYDAPVVMGFLPTG